MKQRTFKKEIFIHSGISAVIDVISNYSRHDKIHPQIEKVERAEQAPAGLDRYLITERLRWGPFGFKVRYQADIVSVTADTVHTEAYRSPGTYVTNISKVTPALDGVVLHETITIKAPDLFFDDAFRQARTAHDELLKRIKNYVEARK
jgi:hypothetical protein